MVTLPKKHHKRLIGWFFQLIYVLLSQKTLKPRGFSLKFSGLFLWCVLKLAEERFSGRFLWEGESETAVSCLWLS